MFLIGSTYFFKSIDGFTSKDIDILELIDNPVGFKTSYQLTGRGKCHYDFIKETLKRIRDKLDDKHLYEAIIFDSYIENNAFKLSNEQLLKAYDVYKKYR